MLTTKETSLSNQLNYGWFVRHGNKVYENATISDIRLDSLKRGDVIIATNTTPVSDVPFPTIMFKSIMTTIDVEIDNQLVYSYGSDYFNNHKHVPKKYNMITLSDGTKAHDIKITFTVAEDDAFKSFAPIFFGTKHDLVLHFFQHKRLSFFAGSFFIIYATLLISLGIFLFLSGRNKNSLFYSAFLSLLLGVYTFTSEDILCFVSDDYRVYAILEFSSLFFIPFAFSVVLYSTHPDIARARQRALIIINLILPFASWRLYSTGLVTLYNFYIVIQVIALVEIILILPHLIRGLLKAHKEQYTVESYGVITSDVYLLTGFILMTFFMLLEILKFYLDNYIDKYQNTYFQSIYSKFNYLGVGMLFFTICLFIYYFMSGIELMNATNLKSQLEGLAYTDSLTGLMNRAMCMQYAATLTADYAVVSLDLDRLKYVNDTFGHIQGDQMIKNFAEILNEAFSTANIIGRTGGDEFLVIYKNPNAMICNEAIELMEEKIKEFNQRETLYKISASAGYAYSFEVKDGKYDEVFYLADTRMYEMKEKHHA